MQHGENLQHL
jgi:hypothetical protein